MQKLGVLDLLDEESRFPKGTDKTLLEKLHGAHKVGGGGGHRGKGRAPLGTFGLLCVFHICDVLLLGQPVLLQAQGERGQVRHPSLRRRGHLPGGRPAGEEPRHLPGRHPQDAQGQQVGWG